jgi:hypothetical protein
MPFKDPDKKKSYDALRCAKGEHRPSLEAAREASRKYALSHPDRKRRSYKDFYEKNGDAMRERSREYHSRPGIRERERFAKYNITVEQGAALWASQGECCAICRRVPTTTPHIDHNHTTNIVRGLLCARCNHLLGHAKDSIEPLKQAVAYLRKGLTL